MALRWINYNISISWSFLTRRAKAIDSYFIELQEVVAKPLILKKEEHLRVSCVLVDPSANTQVLDFMERETRLELATPTLARLCSTN